MPEIPKPVKVILTAEANNAVSLGGRRQRQITAIAVEDYNIVTAMDTDADNFGVQIGDPSHELVALMKRDVEIRVQIFGGDDESSYLKVGFCDSATLSHDGTLTISGRDVSALAVDSTAPPNEWKNARAHKRIKKEAIELGFPETRLQEVKQFDKIYTDGSETYWEFWYRMARKRKMWLWCEPNGTLVMDELNYKGDPRYFFGHPRDKFPGKKWVPVTACEITSNKQTRVGEIHVFGESNDLPFYAHEFDKSISSWLKKPNKVMFDSTIETQKEAQETAYEEIFEGKVGAVEITLTIPDPGVVIKQNNIAQLNLPEIGIVGEYYIVGTTMMGSQGGGFVQNVRLREKSMALSRRVPDDPELILDENEGSIPGTVYLDIPMPEWADYFIRAAKEWTKTGIGIDLWTATMLAMCEKETNFRNIRSNVDGDGDAPVFGRVGTIWYAPNSSNESEQHKDFANQDDNRLTNFNTFAVGPMQLFTHAYKVDADTHSSNPGEYDGGRWEPEHNIWASAKALNSKMAGLPGSRPGLYAGVRAYNGAGSEAETYAREVFKLVDDKYLPMVQAAFEASASTGSEAGVNLEDAPAVVKRAVTTALQQLGDPYEWAASGPNSFDCSGLCWYAYKIAGLPNIGSRWSTYSLWPNQYKRVMKPDLRAGDLVFFHNPPSHMGMYLGDGTMVQAPSTGDVVKISSITEGYYQTSYIGAQRPVSWGTEHPPGP